MSAPEEGMREKKRVNEVVKRRCGTVLARGGVRSQ
jgi:hypothetical protein